MKHEMNELWCRNLLEKDDLDYNKFYKHHIEFFLDISRKDNKELKRRIDKAIGYIKGWQSFPHTNGSTHNELRNLLNILQGEDKNE